VQALAELVASARPVPAAILDQDGLVVVATLDQDGLEMEEALDRDGLESVAILDQAGREDTASLDPDAQEAAAALDPDVAAPGSAARLLAATRSAAQSPPEAVAILDQDDLEVSAVHDRAVAVDQATLDRACQEV
jgi:hypothetical protein